MNDNLPFWLQVFLFWKDYMWPGLKMMLLELCTMITMGSFRQQQPSFQSSETGPWTGHYFGHPNTAVESGVITKLTILCPPRPNAVNIAFFACSSFEHVLRGVNLVSVTMAKVSVFSHQRGRVLGSDVAPMFSQIRFWLVTCGCTSEMTWS